MHEGKFQNAMTNMFFSKLISADDFADFHKNQSDNRYFFRKMLLVPLSNEKKVDKARF